MKRIARALLGFFIFALALATPLAAQEFQLRTAAITGDTVAYASGDLVGGKLALTDPNTAAPALRGRIVGVTLTDLAAQTGNVDVIFFSSDPSATTFTNNAALDVDDADLPRVIGSVALTDADGYADNGIMQPTLANTTSFPPFVITAGSTLYAAVVARAARTQATNNDLTLRVWIERR